MSVFDLVGGLVDTGVNIWQAEKNRDFQATEAEKNRSFQVSMYDRQLDDSIAWRTHQEQYNSPQAQMQRYRDAGINPMYAVTGNAGNMVTTPMSMTSGFGSSPSGGSQPSSSVGSGISSGINHKLQAQQFDLNHRIGDAQVQFLNAQAEKELAIAEGVRSDNVGKEIDAEVNRYLNKLFLSHPMGGDSASFAEFKALRIAQSEEFQMMFDQLSFSDAKHKFEHLKVVREFEKDLTAHKRSMFVYELSQAKSASEVFAVSARWAIANQWINAGSSLVNAATGLAGAFKGTSLMPSMSRSYSESYGDHTSRSYHFNQ